MSQRQRETESAASSQLALEGPAPEPLVGDAWSGALDTVVHGLAPQLGLSPSAVQVTPTPGLQGLAHQEGSQIAVDPQRVDPGTREGQTVIAHEVTHLAQRSAPSNQLPVGLARGAAEWEASSIASDYVAGRRVEAPQQALTGAAAGFEIPDPREVVRQLKMSIAQTIASKAEGYGDARKEDKQERRDARRSARRAGEEVPDNRDGVLEFLAKESVEPMGKFVARNIWKWATGDSFEPFHYEGQDEKEAQREDRRADRRERRHERQEAREERREERQERREERREERAEKRAERAEKRRALAADVATDLIRLLLGTGAAVMHGVNFLPLGVDTNVGSAHFRLFGDGRMQGMSLGGAMTVRLLGQTVQIGNPKGADGARELDRENDVVFDLPWLTHDISGTLPAAQMGDMVQTGRGTISLSEIALDSLAVKIPELSVAGISLVDWQPGPPRLHANGIHFAGGTPAFDNFGLHHSPVGEGQPFPNERFTLVVPHFLEVTGIRARGASGADSAIDGGQGVQLGLDADQMNIGVEGLLSSQVSNPHGGYQTGGGLELTAGPGQIRLGAYTIALNQMALSLGPDGLQGSLSVTSPLFSFGSIRLDGPALDIADVSFVLPLPGGALGSVVQQVTGVSRFEVHLASGHVGLDGVRASGLTFSPDFSEVVSGLDPSQFFEGMLNGDGWSGISLRVPAERIGQEVRDGVAVLVETVNNAVDSASNTASGYLEAGARRANQAGQQLEQGRQWVAGQAWQAGERLGIVGGGNQADTQANATANTAPQPNPDLQLPVSTGSDTPPAPNPDLQLPVSAPEPEFVGPVQEPVLDPALDPDFVGPLQEDAGPATPEVAAQTTAGPTTTGPTTAPTPAPTPAPTSAPTTPAELTAEQQQVVAWWQGGQTDTNALTDDTFFARHTERVVDGQRQGIGRGDTELIAEWQQIRDEVVGPAVRAVVLQPELNPEQTRVLALYQGGETDPNQLSNAVFYERHPELQGQSIGDVPDADQRKALGDEWTLILEGVVKPALKTPRMTSTPVPEKHLVDVANTAYEQSIMGTESGGDYGIVNYHARDSNAVGKDRPEWALGKYQYLESNVINYGDSLRDQFQYDAAADLEKDWETFLSSPEIQDYMFTLYNNGNIDDFFRRMEVQSWDQLLGRFPVATVATEGRAPGPALFKNTPWRRNQSAQTWARAAELWPWLSVSGGNAVAVTSVSGCLAAMHLGGPRSAEGLLKRGDAPQDNLGTSVFDYFIVHGHVGATNEAAPTETAPTLDRTPPGTAPEPTPAPAPAPESGGADSGWTLRGIAEAVNEADKTYNPMRWVADAAWQTGANAYDRWTAEDERVEQPETERAPAQQEPERTPEVRDDPDIGQLVSQTWRCHDRRAILRDEQGAALEPEAVVPVGSYCRVLDAREVDGRSIVKVAVVSRPEEVGGRELGWTNRSNLSPLLRAPRPSDPATQMSTLLSYAKANASAMVGKCYASVKRYIRDCGTGYGDIADIYKDERFEGFQGSAVNFHQAVEKWGAATLGLERLDVMPSAAPAGSLLVTLGNGIMNLSEVHGDIAVVEGVSDGLLIAYNDGRIRFTARDSEWQTGRYRGVLQGIYKPIARR